MDARYAADAVLIVHGGFVLFVIFGGLLTWRWPKVAVPHLAAVAWGMWIMISGEICPLTPLENRFRAQAGLAGYGGGFIEHYIACLIYPAGLTRTVQVALGAGVGLLNLAVYGWAWQRGKRRR